MLIVYIAIILVILGFIFVITSVEVRKEIVVERTGFPRGNADAALMDQQNPSSEVTESSLSELSEMFRNENHSALDSTAVTEHEGSISQENNFAKSLFDVTLYIDESGMSLESGQIDPVSLKKVIREGSGTAEIGADALMIRIGKKLFRYDYYRLDKVGGSGESVLLSVRGSAGATIVIADDPSFFPSVSSEYSLFVNR